MTPSPDNATFTLLCVDDEANILSSLRRLFRPHGYTVLIATGGAEGLEILDKQPVDLIISDMRMPGMDGAAFLAEARQRHPDTVRLLLTGYADMDSTIAAINAGQIARYIAKPWNDQDVLLTVREALERKALEREKNRLEALTLAQNAELKALNASLEDKVEARTAELKAAHEKLKQQFLTSIRVFSNLIELREGVISGHSRRVADLARKIAIKLNFPSAEVQDVMLSGLLHDVGKIGLPDELLSKPVSHMSGDELGLLRKHPVTGQAALMGIDNLRKAGTFIRGHHERWDGQGYPDRLSGLAIPYGARVLAVANDFDSLQIGSLSPRKMKPDEAIAFIQQNRGKRYCPQAVDALTEVLGAAETAGQGGHDLNPSSLKPGMVLARDLVTRDGVMLLAADFVLDESLIRQLRELEASEGIRLSIAIRPDKPA
ncbi:HD domain-containing phosphohydrolase [Zoogloea dura]|jgi:response regulator RpfG family c-di-GMP phosphodiesterase|uniref:Response regulator n=1 Tax=Zoogloea dura TaxID=2728840 RepID=A0A848GCG9_9RHOO|nr:HD domain-containing phosphohydrolase [Zoogloea dura]NML28083.1 response regulator [Zoogloea dura]